MTGSQLVQRATTSVPRGPGVLIVDDLGLILTLLKCALEPCGFTVWLALDGDTALELFRRHRANIHVVLLDVQVPGLDGPNTLAAMQRIDPGVRACFMTGDPGPYTRDGLLERGGACVLDKPFHPTDVIRSLRKLLLSAGDAGEADSPLVTTVDPRSAIGT